MGTSLSQVECSTIEQLHFPLNIVLLSPVIMLNLNNQTNSVSPDHAGPKSAV